MKRRITISLILSITILFFLTKDILANSALEQYSGIVKSFLQVDSNSFMLTSDGLLCISEDGCEKMCDIENIDLLIPSDEGIYGFDKNEQRVLKLNNYVWDSVITLSSNQIKKALEKFDSDMVSLDSMAICDDKLFALYEGQVGLEQEKELISISFKTLKVEKLPCQGLEAFTSWDNECLLFYRIEQNRQVDDNYTISTYNVSTKHETVLFQSQYPLKNVSVSNKKIHCISLGEMYRINKKREAIRIGYITDHYLGSGSNIFSMYQISDNEYLTLSPDGSIFIDDLSLQQDYPTIRISGSTKNTGYYSFLEKNPNVRVVVDIPSLTASEIYVDIETGRNIADIYLIDIGEGYTFLKEKGYLGSIEDNQVIDGVVKTYYEPIRKVIYLNDKLVAIPEYFSLNTWTVNETAWNQCIPNEHMPSTFIDLLQFLIRWNDVYAEQFPEVLPLEFGGDRLELIIEIVREYIFQYSNSIEELSFDTPVFREIMEMVKSISIEKNISEIGIDQFNSQTKLLSISPWNQYGIFYDGEDRIVPIEPMKISNDATARIPANMYVYILNPNLENKEIAIKYLEEVILTQDPMTRAGMISDWSEEVLSERGRKKLEALQERKHEIILEMQQSDEDRISELQIQLLLLEEEYEDVRLSAYLVSSESIANYQKLAQFMCMPIESPFYDYQGKEAQVLNRILKKYNDNQIDLNELIKELESLLWMIKEE